jgi:hypothetical protein
MASIIRFTVFFKTDAFTDMTWESVPLVGWSVVEGGMYLIAACLPLLRPVFAKHTPEWLKRKVSSTIKSYANKTRSRDTPMKSLTAQTSVSIGRSKTDMPSESEIELVKRNEGIEVTTEISMQRSDSKVEKVGEAQVADKWI